MEVLAIHMEATGIAKVGPTGPRPYQSLSNQGHASVSQLYFTCSKVYSVRRPYSRQTQLTLYSSVLSSTRNSKQAQLAEPTLLVTAEYVQEAEEHNCDHDALVTVY